MQLIQSLIAHIKVNSANPRPNPENITHVRVDYDHTNDVHKRPVTHTVENFVFIFGEDILDNPTHIVMYVQYYNDHTLYVKMKHIEDIKIEVETVFNSSSEHYELKDSPTLKELFPEGNFDWFWLWDHYPHVIEMDNAAVDFSNTYSTEDHEVYPYEFFLYPDGLQHLNNLKPQA